LVAELNEDRREENTGILFSGVLESKIGGQVCWPGVGEAFYIVDNR
jgi:hypothetical protein